MLHRGLAEVRSRAIPVLLALGRTTDASSEARFAESLDLHRRALAIRRDRAERHSGFIFVPWELTRSLNTVGDP